jgi:hypothetical protein
MTTSFNGFTLNGFTTVGTGWSYTNLTSTITGNLYYAGVGSTPSINLAASIPSATAYIFAVGGGGGGGAGDNGITGNGLGGGGGGGGLFLASDLTSANLSSLSGTVNIQVGAAGAAGAAGANTVIGGYILYGGSEGGSASAYANGGNGGAGGGYGVSQTIQTGFLGGNGGGGAGGGVGAAGGAGNGNRSGNVGSGNNGGAGGAGYSISLKDNLNQDFIIYFSGGGGGNGSANVGLGGAGGAGDIAGGGGGGAGGTGNPITVGGNGLLGVGTMPTAINSKGGNNGSGSAPGEGGGGGGGAGFGGGGGGNVGGGADGAVFLFIASPVSVPSKPPALTLVSRTSTSITVSGDSSSEVETVTDVEFYSEIPGGFTILNTNIYTETAKVYTITYSGLSPSTTYNLTWRLKSSAGFGTSSDPLTETTLSGGPPCFLRGSKILCLKDGKEEYVPIEDMRAGTEVKTLNGAYVKVHTIGKTLYNNPDNADRGPYRLFRLTPSNYPELNEDLIITGCHSILVDKLEPSQKARHLQLMKTLYMTTGKFRLMAFIDEKAEPYQNPGKHEIWHFALENENVVCNYGVYANGGLLVETASIKNMTERSGLALIE